MAALLILSGLIFYTESDVIQDYVRHSNGSDRYELVWATPCNTGLHESGYALTLSNKVFLKQVSEDGAVGPVCSN